jgi:hypothetical protein
VVRLGLGCVFVGFLFSSLEVPRSAVAQRMRLEQDFLIELIPCGLACKQARQAAENRRRGVTRNRKEEG